MKESRLFDSFSVPDRSAWENLANSEIGEGNKWQSLRWNVDTLTFEPIYSSDDVKNASYMDSFRFKTDSLGPNPRHWENVPEIVVTDEVTANKIALEHLQHEAEGIIFTVHDSSINFSALLNGIAWEHCNVSFRAAETFPYDDLFHFIKQNGLAAEKISGTIFTSNLSDLPKGLLNFRTSLKLCGIVIQGDSAVDQIANALTSGNKVISDYQGDQTSIEDVVGSMAFSFPIGRDLLTEVSKFKAFRNLWYQLVRAYGFRSYNRAHLYLHGYSGAWRNENFQPHGNMLKSTIASIAGICGGCNAITVSPENIENPVMVRIARNTSAILREESHLGKVFDPFAGAYAVDVMTDTISREAWKLFQTRI